MDGLGNPVEFLLSRGNEHDSTRAIELLSKINISESNILGDKAYGSKSIREYITGQNAAYTIPPRSCNSEQWFCDWWVYKERHLVECFFQKVKWFRRIAAAQRILCKSKKPIKQNRLACKHNYGFPLNRLHPAS